MWAIPPFFLFLAWQPSWLAVGITGHFFGRWPSKDHSTKVWLQLAQWFLKRRLKCEMLRDGFQLTWPLGHVSYCHNFSSVIRPSTFHILIFSSETNGPISTKLWWNGPWVTALEICVRWSRFPTKMSAKLKIEKGGDEIKKNLPLWNHWANLNQLCRNDHWVVPFQNCVWHFRPPIKMDATAELNLT
jgi:hypothetical protein